MVSGARYAAATPIAVTLLRAPPAPLSQAAGWLGRRQPPVSRDFGFV